MNVYAVTQVDRDLLLAGADLEAVLAEREQERLERDDRTEAVPDAEAPARPGRRASKPDEDLYTPSPSVPA